MISIGTQILTTLRYFRLIILHAFTHMSDFLNGRNESSQCLFPFIVQITGLQATLRSLESGSYIQIPVTKGKRFPIY